jgi:tetratricopeptide (TPR) repeat protein
MLVEGDRARFGSRPGEPTSERPAGGEADRADGLPREACGRLEELLREPPASAGEPLPERVGCLAILRGYLTAPQLEEALEEQRRQARPGNRAPPLGRILVERRLLDEEALALLLREQAARRPLPPRLGRYSIREFLGEGATAAVYRGVDGELGRPVAVKVLKAGPSTSRGAPRRFFREAQAIARLSHPNVVAVYDFGEEGGRFYLVMELVPGKPLRRLMESPPADRALLLRLLAKAADGLQHAHEHGIVHRDVKPENVLVSEAGEPKLADFGLAHLLDSTTALTRTGAALGTPHYMAPEQVEGRSRQVTPRTDVYALGAILYEVLTGLPPHSGETVTQVFSGILSRDPAPPCRRDPSVPPGLARIALQALEKDPARRTATAREFADDLRRHLAGEPVMARPPGPARRITRRLRKHPWAAGLAVAGLLAAALAVGGGLSAAERGRRLEGEAAAALAALREQARLSLSAALRLRRAGANSGMRDFLPDLESAYREALRRAPGLAEAEYLMGRMHRALLEDDKALAYQERALAKDPDYAPALYERVVLLSKSYSPKLRRATQRAHALPRPPESPLPPPPPLDADRLSPSLAEARRRLLDDCDRLERLIRPGRPGPAGIDEACVRAARGIFAYHRGAPAEARELLREAVRRQPLLEEAWETLALTCGSDPGEGREAACRELIALYGEALSHDRGYAPFHLGLGYARNRLGFCKAQRGEDPTPDFDASEAHLAQAVLLGGALDLKTRAVMRTARGAFRMRRGEDPSADFDGARADLDRCLDLHPRDAEAWWRRGILHTHRGTRARDGGRDPTADFGAAEEDLRRAVRLDPAYVEFRNALGMLFLQRGLFQVRRKEDPAVAYAEAEREFGEALRHVPWYTSAWKNRGSLRALKAAAAEARGADPVPDLAEAEKDFGGALATHPGHVNATAERARVRAEKAACYERRGDAEAAAAEYAAAARDYEDLVARQPHLEPEYRAPLEHARKKAAERTR